MPQEIIKIGLAVICDGSLLLVRKRGSNCYILPGGKPELGEDDLTALVREIDEELGCTINMLAIRYIGTFRDRAADLLNTEVVVKLYAGALAGNPAPRAEIEQVMWLNPLIGTKLELAPSLNNSILPYLFEQGGITPGSDRACG